MEQRNIDKKRLYLNDGTLTSFEAEVLSCEKSERGYEIILDKTAFFAGGGGQEADEGAIDGVPLLAVFERDGETVHLSEKCFDVGSKVFCEIDRTLRFRRMQGHGGEHVLSGILHSMFGTQNAGFHLGKNEVVTIDTRAPLTAEQLRLAEAEANRKICENIPIKAYFPTEDELKDMSFRSKIDFEGEVRIVEIEGVDCCACCAPHFPSTAPIGIIKIVDAISWKGGMRLTVLCGLAAYDDYAQKHISVREISAALSAKQNEIADAVKNTVAKNDEAHKKAEMLAKELREMRISSLTGGKIACVFDENADANGLRDYANKLKEKYTLCVAFAPSKIGYTYAAASKTLDMSVIKAKIAEALNGKGGGSGEMIFGSFDAERSTAEEFFTTLSKEF
ncbi:MAG: hypothetical protein IKB35_00015 [Clostridia bacterium]|nr:hypothetical protein [Clostridia bacterium]